MNLIELFQGEQDLLTVPMGETVFSLGDPGDVMYVLMSGSADIVVHGKVVETAGAGAILGEMSMIDDSPRAATVVAKTECKLVVIEPRGFRFLIQESPDFAIHVMRVMADRIRNTDRFLPG